MFWLIVGEFRCWMCFKNVLTFSSGFLHTDRNSPGSVGLLNALVSKAKTVYNREAREMGGSFGRTTNRQTRAEDRQTDECMHRYILKGVRRER